MGVEKISKMVRGGDGRAQRNEEEGDRVFLKRREEGRVWMGRNKGGF